MSVTLEHPAKAAGRNEMPFGRDTRVVQVTCITHGPPLEGEIWGLDWVSKPQSKFALQVAAKRLWIVELLP